LGGWIPGVISSASLKGSQAARYSIAEIYRKEGLNVCITHQAEESAVYQLWQLLVANKIRSSLAGFLAAYRARDEEALLLLCCQALILGRADMRTKPLPKPREPWPHASTRGPLAWMA
jgi:hypothetical protein